MTALPTDNMEKRLLSNSAKLLMLRRQPEVCVGSKNAEILIANLAYINEQADAKGDTLLSVSSLLIQEVIDEIYANDEVPEKSVIDKAITWHEQARRYVKNPDDKKNITCLINKIPQDLQEDMKSYIKQCNEKIGNDDLDLLMVDELLGSFDIFDDVEGFQCVDNSDALDLDKALEAIDTPNSLEDNGVSPWDQEIDFDGFTQDDESLAAENQSIPIIVANEFSSLVARLDVIDMGELHDAVSECGAVILGLEGLRQSCIEARLDGMQLIFDFVVKNLSHLDGVDEKEKRQCLGLLGRVASNLLLHLHNPIDDSICISLVECLTEAGWLLPLNYREEKNIIYALVRQQEAYSTDNEQALPDLEVKASQVSLAISADASPSLIDSFFAESDRYAEELATSVAQIAKGVDVQNNIRIAQRLSHTLKGSANLLGVQGIANLAHYLEDIFDYLTHHNTRPSMEMAESMQEAADTIEIMVECLASGEAEPENALAVLQSIVTWIHTLAEMDSNGGLYDTAVPKSGYQEYFDSVVGEEKAPLPIVNEITEGCSGIVESSTLETEEVENEVQGLAVKEESSQQQNIHTEVLRVPRQLIDNILNLVGETSISLGQMQEKLLTLSSYSQNIHAQDRTLQTKRFELEELINIQGLSSQHKHLRVVNDKGISAKFDSLEMDEYNEFYGATHSYIETVADTRSVTRNVIDEVDELETLFIQQQRLNHALQDMVMSTRMVAVNTVGARLQRTVRQAARMTGKEVELSIYGENLQVDSDLLAQLVDPIMHLLRNAVDHGIESREIRFEKGKESVGRIHLRFSQEGNHLVVECGDDGSGLDYGKILEKAHNRGIVGEQHLEKEAIARLILSPGFSTREKVTQVSGRGVGMDVVNTAVANMKGNLTIQDHHDGSPGTFIVLRLPVTLLTNHSILIQAQDKQFAIPTNTLEQILTPGAGTLDMMGSQLSYILENSIYPAVTLNSLIHLDDETLDLNKASLERPVLLINIDSQVHAVVIDSVSSAVELVIKGFGPYVGNVSGILGVSLLGNGAIIPVIDLPQLMRQRAGAKLDTRFALAGSGHEDESHSDTIGISAVKVLIVDDSLSARDSLAELARDAGFTPILARDGLEALHLIKGELPDLVLTDLEMPRMNGLELTSHIRADGNSSHIPIVMITSRSMQKHRDEAHKAGVTEYVTKPYVAEELMVILSNNLAQRAV